MRTHTLYATATLARRPWIVRIHLFRALQRCRPGSANHPCPHEIQADGAIADRPVRECVVHHGIAAAKVPLVASGLDNLPCHIERTQRIDDEIPCGLKLHERVMRVGRCGRPCQCPIVPLCGSSSQPRQVPSILGTHIDPVRRPHFAASVS